MYVLFFPFDTFLPFTFREKFVRSVCHFFNHFEIRTYWINEKYAYAVGTLTEAVGKNSDGLPISDENTFVSEGGKIPDRIKKKLRALGKKVSFLIVASFVFAKFLNTFIPSE